jgi:tripeptide aminopeptidase
MTNMKETLKEIIPLLPGYEKQLENMLQIVLTNLVMINEIPAPTFDEDKRTRFIMDRFSEYELQNCSTDEKRNALGVLPGKDESRNILIEAHLDTPFPAKTDHSVTIHPDRVVGAGVGDNGLGLAAVVSLPLILQHLGIELESNLVLMGSSRSLAHGDLEGIRFFLKNTELPITAGLCVEGVKLGRLSYSSIGMLRGELTLWIPEEYDWTRFGAGGSVVSMNEVINKILEIPLPRKPQTTIVLGSLCGGSSFNTIARKATLGFEIRSESHEMVGTLAQNIDYIAAEIAAKAGANSEFRILARRAPGGLSFSDPLTTAGRTIVESLGIKPRMSPSTSELSAFIANSIPALTIGLTNGEYLNEPGESIEIKPICKGLAQLVGMIQAIDRGYNNESE